MNPALEANGGARRRVLIGACLFLVVAASIALTARDPGLTWDEGIYYGFALRYFDFFQNLSAESFSEARLHYTWWDGQVHPPLGKLWIALNLIAFAGGLDVVSAARMGAAIVFGLAALTLYGWIARRRGERVGLMAAGAFVLMPRIFGHAHFANLEMLTVLLWLATTVAFERGLYSRKWSVACGILFGLALLTKINALFLPVVLGAWGLIFHGRKAWRNLIVMAVAGPLLFWAGWPALWHHPVAGIRAYLADKAARDVIPVFYLGRTYGDPSAPFHYPFVMLLASTPLPILAAGGIGIARFVRRLKEARREAAYEGLVLANFAFPVLLLAAPGVPRYDGIRLMLCAFPFLAVLAAEGAWAVWERLEERVERPRRTAAWIGGATLAWLLISVALFHPFQLCYYSELVGGPWGARRLGFETTYWNETLDDDAVTWLNRRVPPNGRVAFVAVGGLVWQYYPAMGEARQDIGVTEFDRGDWDYLVVVPRQGMLSDEVKAFMRTHNPVWSKGPGPFDSPAVCLIYARPST